jgi:hypothetical protein
MKLCGAVATESSPDGSSKPGKQYWTAEFRFVPLWFFENTKGSVCGF